ncbi:MAG: hypothetical protein NC816_06205 [Candidatus Omnitrophica bacterium]|nr:hypothetical protein [Candidatus Omnitrophota bacterium]
MNEAKKMIEVRIDYGINFVETMRLLCRKRGSYWENFKRNRKRDKISSFCKI